MQILPPALEQLIEQLVKLPGIGQKSATRLALNILRKPPGLARELATALSQLHSSIRLCSSCCSFSASDPCALCGDPRRQVGVICVVEQSGDLLAIEKTGSYRGHYHILHGVISPMDGIGPDMLRVKELQQRVTRDSVTEIILATNPTVEGDTTAMYLAGILKPFGVKVTRIAHGMPVGGDLDYADQATLIRALEWRREI